MERIYYPSPKKFFNERYIYPAIWFCLVWLAFMFLNVFIQSQSLSAMLATYPFVWILIILTNIVIEGFRGDRLAIKLTRDSIYGPIKVGRDMPIPFNEIDFEKTRKKKRFCSIQGDEIKFEQRLFDPEDVAEIWKTISKFDKKNK